MATDQRYKRPKTMFRFRIELEEAPNPIWRLIDVPENYSFWDLHVAIQDSMGWLDYHLHEFRATRPKSRLRKPVGLPHDEEMLPEVLPGWQVPLTRFFQKPGDVMEYLYDFGDGWTHEVTLAGMILAEPERRYPACIDGAGACPPEDCGGVWGYQRLLAVIRDEQHEEREELVGWLRGMNSDNWPFDPMRFDRASVRFDSPKKRLRMVLEGG